MPPIFLSDGSISEVSKEDHIFLAGYNWFPSGGYARGSVDGKQIQMHRLVAKRMGLDLSAEVDHIDRDRLNNRRENLRAPHAHKIRHGGTIISPSPDTEVCPETGTDGAPRLRLIKRLFT